MASLPFGSNIEDDLPMMQMEPAVINEPAMAKKGVGVIAQYSKRVEIVLEDNDGIPPTGQFFGHNGNGFMLKPGVKAIVPLELIDILNNAIYDAPEVDPTTRQIIGYRPRLRFPYRITNPNPTLPAAT